MKGRKLTILMACIYALIFPILSSAEEQKDAKKSKDPFEIPSHVLDISKENTYPNTTENQEVIEPSELTKELMEGTDIPIKNPDLIKMLNESTLDPSPVAIGYRGMIYLGRWPLNYESLETNINWEYQKINTNELNNLGGDANQVMNYVQQEQKEIKGALTNKIKNPDDVKKMMLLATKEKTKLPLSYQTIIGKNTKKENSYNIPAEKFGVLNAFAPAVNEKGQVTFGEVYVQLKGSNKGLIIKNVTKQGIGGWIPIQDHVSFSFQIK
ncbi:YfkD family protein [Oceanobacillus caeni]|uniref:YfkD famly protein n=1 Tax=Oceanobacillus caeni TaxID=405946 RepID=UPI001C24AA11|nr:YfkD famly protein [Oceanobacillus caeni]MBU8791810.1 YfkD family protein [Oceanobacillus caeni]